MILKKLFGANPDVKAAKELYRVIVLQARQPEFYLHADVPDTVDGRYEMISLHAFLVLRRLKREEGNEKGLSQAIFDFMFKDMDQSLREIGVGDLSVGKRIKKMAQVFYGRVVAYEQALDGGDETLESALARNHYGTLEVPPSDATLGKMADYIRRSDEDLKVISIEKVRSGEIPFSSFEE
jgi:cytochrome b pre-mRNA-processing protein 3